jgi:hypothetical protein
VDGDVAGAFGSGRDRAPAPFLDNEDVAADELALVVVDKEGRRPVEHHDQHVALTVHVRWRPLPRRPDEDGRIQVFGRLDPDRSSRSVAPALRFAVTVGELELGADQPLDQGEELSLLEADVRLKQVTELARDGAVFRSSLEPRDKGVQPLMLEQGLDDQRASIVGVGDKRKECLLLLTDVTNGDVVEEAAQLGCHASRLRRVRGPDDPPGLDQRVVVVV